MRMLKPFNAQQNEENGDKHGGIAEQEPVAALADEVEVDDGRNNPHVHQRKRQPEIARRGIGLRFRLHKQRIAQAGI
jgi:hypothetical protein